MTAKFFYTIVCGFLLGITLHSFVTVSLPVIGFVGVIALALVLFSLTAKEKVAILLLAGCFLGAGALGLLRYHATLSTDPVLVSGDGRITVSGVGILVREPEPRDTETRLVARVDSVEVLGKTVSLSDTRMLIHAPQYFDALYGDRIVFTGALRQPKNFKNDSGVEFDYKSYLAADHIYYEVDRGLVEVTAHGEGSKIKSALFGLKQSFLAHIQTSIPEPESALAAGLIVGARQSLGHQIQEEMRISGVIHMVVLSGYNLTLVAKTIMTLLRPLPKLIGSVGGVISIFLFTMLAGGGAATVRAALMASLLVAADVTGRRSAITRALLVAALAMILWNPETLVFDPSFQLSFLAMLGLIHVSPRLEEYLGFVTKRFGLREITAATIGTQVLVTPFLIATSGSVSPLSVVANLLILPFVPLAMLLGALVGGIGYVSALLAQLLAFPTTFVLTYMLAVVHGIASVPFASLTVVLPHSVIFGTYLLFSVWLWRNAKTLSLEDERFVAELKDLTSEPFETVPRERSS